MSEETWQRLQDICVQLRELDKKLEAYAEELRLHGWRVERPKTSHKRLLTLAGSLSPSQE